MCSKFQTREITDRSILSYMPKLTNRALCLVQADRKTDNDYRKASLKGRLVFIPKFYIIIVPMSTFVKSI